MSKRILFICQQAPYGNSLAKESLDAILAASVYEQDIAVVFWGAGAYQLLPDQAGEAIALKTLSKALAAFALYGIEQVFVEASKLDRLNIQTSQLACSPQSIDATALQQLMQQYDVIVPF